MLFTRGIIVLHLVLTSHSIAGSVIGDGAEGGCRSTLAVVARARLDGALAAGPAHGVRHCGARDGVDEGCLAATCSTRRVL